MARKPKYGYARDYFGRVLERDILNEERGDENWQSYVRQQSYDYSSYDAEDENESYF